MSEYNNNAGGRPQGGRGRGSSRRRSGPPPRGASNSSRGGFRPSRKPPEPTGLQKFLTVITFGLYKPQSIPPVRSSSRSAERERDREHDRDREPGPIARSDREARESSRREGRENREPREPRTPRASSHVSTEVVSERLYVGNLSYDAAESDLFELFSGAGAVRNAEVVVNTRTQRSKGFAFVTMTTLDAAKKAVADLNGQDFMGRPLIVGGAKPMPARDDRSESNSETESSEPASQESSSTEAVA